MRSLRTNFESTARMCCRRQSIIVDIVVAFIVALVAAVNGEPGMLGSAVCQKGRLRDALRCAGGCGWNLLPEKEKVHLSSSTELFDTVDGVFFFG